MANIQDVARAAGVSTASISRFLAGKPVRSSAVIAATIAELGYSPSAVARSLRSGHHGSIGVVVPDVTNPFFASLIKGIEKVTRGAGYHVLLGNSDEDAAQEKAILADLIERTDGIILAPLAETDRALGGLVRAGIPTVFVDRELGRNSMYDRVLVDNRSGSEQAVDHLFSLGHRRIGIISGPLGSTPGRARHEGFIAALYKHGAVPSSDLMHVSDFREEGGYRSMGELWGLPQRPTAVFIANNLMTIGALNALKDLGASVPTDISVVGFDDFTLAGLLDPPLTVVRRPEIDQGSIAARMLLGRIEDQGEAAPQRVTLPVELIVRASTAPVPTALPENRTDDL